MNTTDTVKVGTFAHQLAEDILAGDLTAIGNGAALVERGTARPKTLRFIEQALAARLDGAPAPKAEEAPVSTFVPLPKGVKGVINEAAVAHAEATVGRYARNTTRDGALHKAGTAKRGYKLALRAEFGRLASVYNEGGFPALKAEFEAKGV